MTYNKERYYTEEPLENVYPLQSERENQYQKHFEPLESQINVDDKLDYIETIAEKTTAPKKEIKHKKSLIYIMFLIQTDETIIDKDGKEYPADPKVEIKPILVDTELGFKHFISNYEQMPNGILFEKSFYPFQIKGAIIRIMELTEEDLLHLKTK